MITDPDELFRQAVGIWQVGEFERLYGDQLLQLAPIFVAQGVAVRLQRTTRSAFRTAATLPEPLRTVASILGNPR